MSNGRDWHATDTATLRRLAASGMSDNMIGLEMDRHPKFIGQKRREHEIRAGQSPLYTAMMARINMRRMMRRARA